MRLEHHIVVSAAVSGVVFAVSRSWPATISSFAVGVLLDGDHVIECFREFGFRFSLRDLFRASYERTFKKTILVLHAWEWMPFAVLVCWALQWNPWATGATIGWFQHLLADQLVNTPNKWAYSLIWRWRHGFDHKGSFPFHGETSRR